MSFSPQQYAQALHESLQDVKPKDQDKVIANLIETLKRNGDLSKYESVIAAYEVYDRTQKGIKDVEITTAQDITLNKDMIQHLNDVVGKKMDIKHKTDSNLIGGVVVRVDDTLIDGSIKHHLDTLKKTLESN